jgi:DMSO/TMAO reductase YedYZ molybdopterin-dependent catalytic subunit
VKCADWKWAHCSIVWLVVSILLTACGALPVSTPQPDVILVVSGNVVDSGTWDADRLKSLGLVEEIAFQPIGGEEVISQGILLRDLLDALEPAPGARRVVFTDSDGDRVEMPLDEAQACAECLVAFGQLGRELHLVMPGQPAKLWVKNLVSIEIQ